MADRSVTETKVRENRLRRWAGRMGLGVRKSRGLVGLENRGGYMVVDVSSALNVSGGIPLAGWNYDLTLNDVEDYLKDYEKKLSVQG